ncbi:MAG TPA: hypothetical protein VJ851_00635 [Jatrophihabitans sp.]|nr:hypothetical protein [Jatrophihabitans sp.]
MALSDLREMLDAPVLKLPIGGKTYTVAAADAETWLRLQDIHNRSADLVAGRPAAASRNADAVTGLTEIDMYRLALGPTFDQLVAAKISGPELKHAGLTAYFWQIGEEKVAELMWESAGKAQPARRRSSRSTTSTSTGAATTTRRRVSGSGTNSRRK